MTLSDRVVDQTSYSFVRQFTGAVVAAFTPVVMVAFWSIPLNLVGHPGEVRAAAMPASTHTT